MPTNRQRILYILSEKNKATNHRIDIKLGVSIDVLILKLSFNDKT